MKKFLLLTTAVLLSSASVYAVCNPNLPACQCSYPEMKNGIIGCSETYCEIGTNCMPDGSCCPTDNYCESTEQEKQCCSDGQTCDTTKGCVEKKAAIETLCANAEGGGSIVTATSGSFCMSNDSELTWSEADVWCQNNGMHLATVDEICSGWNGGECLVVKRENGSIWPAVWTATEAGVGNAFFADLNTGEVWDLQLKEFCAALCL